MGLSPCPPTPRCRQLAPPSSRSPQRPSRRTSRISPPGVSRASSSGLLAGWFAVGALIGGKPRQSQRLPEVGGASERVWDSGGNQGPGERGLTGTVREQRQALLSAALLPKACRDLRQTAPLLCVRKVLPNHRPREPLAKPHPAAQT